MIPPSRFMHLCKFHRRRKQGARGVTCPPPKFQVGGGIAPPPTLPTACLHNQIHCSIVDGIACRHCSSRKSHFCCLKKCRPPPQVRTSSYAYEFYCSSSQYNFTRHHEVLAGHSTMQSYALEANHAKNPGAGIGGTYFIVVM